MKTVSNLAFSNLKKDKTRSILVTTTIIMTTMLLTMIALIGNGIIKMNKENAKDMYGSFYGRYANMTEEQFAQMQLRSEFTDIGRTDVFGNVDNERELYLAWADEIQKELTNMDKMLIEGHWPKAGNEITAQRSFFVSIGEGQPQIGDTVSIPYRSGLDSKYELEEFIISGFLEDTEVTTGPSIGYISESYYKNTVPEEKRRYNTYFRMDDSIGITIDNAQERMEEIGEALGINAIHVNDNFVYLMWTLDPGTETITMCAVVILLVIFFSAIVIYNIFQVGIVQKVQEYGKLKAIGATKRQMRQTVFYEGMMLAAAGIPLGLITGYGLASTIFQWLGEMINTKVNVEVQTSLFSFPLLLLSAALSVITVWIALKKPMKIVASISPIEAMRYQESTAKGKGLRKGKENIGVWGMTVANLMSNKRRTFATIISMGLSCVLFMVMANFIGNMDMKYEARQLIPHGEFQIELNYVIEDRAYPENNLDSILAENPLNQELMQEIEKIDKVTEIKKELVLYAEVENATQESQKVAIQVLSRTDFEARYNANGRLGTFHYDEVSAENGIIYGWSYFMEENGYSMDQVLNLQTYDGENKKVWDTRIMGGFGSTNGSFAITEDTYRNLGLSENAINKIWIDCDQKDIAAVEEMLNDIVAAKEHIQIKTYHETYESYIMSMQITQVGGYTVCIIIAFISFMNMANTIITSIITRKQEFGILQAIGMTNKQLNFSLQMEGILFTVGSILVSFAVGIPMGYALFSYGKNNGFVGMHIYHFPILEAACMIFVLAAVQILLSFIMSRNIKKESLVERIRYKG